MSLLPWAICHLAPSHHSAPLPHHTFTAAGLSAPGYQPHPQEITYITNHCSKRLVRDAGSRTNSIGPCWSLGMPMPSCTKQCSDPILQGDTHPASQKRKKPIMWEMGRGVGIRGQGAPSRSQDVPSAHMHHGPLTVALHSQPRFSLPVVRGWQTTR